MKQRKKTKKQEPRKFNPDVINQEKETSFDVMSSLEKGIKKGVSIANKLLNG